MPNGDNHAPVTVALLENMRDLLALIYTIGFFVALGIAMFHGLPTQGSEALKMLLTIMATAQVTILGWYYGGAKTQQGGSPNVTAVNSNVSTESTKGSS